MKRRNFLSLVSGGLGSVALFSCSKEFAESPYHVAAAKRGGGAGARYPLRIPGIVDSPNGYILNCKNGGSMDVGGKTVSNLWSYNGEYPAKTLVARKGTQVKLTMTNNLPEHTITHWHGMIVNSANDGGPMLEVATGGSYSYDYPIIQRAAMNWYHPHPHLLTGKQVNLGMAGAFIIRDTIEDGLNLPGVPYEMPLILRDATIDRNGNLSYKTTSGGFNGQVSMVNGIISPYLNVKRGIYRFRILNGANSRIFGLALSVTDGWRLIGNDGGLLPTVTAPSRMDIAPAERLDVLVNFNGYPDNTKLYLKDLRAGTDLLEFRVNGDQTGTFLYPAAGSALVNDIIPLSNPVTTRTFSFDGMTKINGKVYDMERIDWQVPFGQVEKWILRTNGNAPHPVHIHGASFMVISRSGGRAQLYPWEGGWKDTVLLEDNETVEVLIRFDAYKGIYLMHCHKLEHEDLGMMANFEVV